MKILSVEQIREADRYTIEHEPISSIDLMERASSACLRWLLSNKSSPLHRKKLREDEINIFCGTGNNGGDGLAIARMLLKKNVQVSVFIVSAGNEPTKDFLQNKNRLEKFSRNAVTEIKSVKQFPQFNKKDVVIDAIFGTGLSRKPEGLFAKTIECMNKSGAKIISVDMPSGLFADVYTPHKSIIQATHTLSFQLPKLSFLFPENEKYVGEWHILDIGIDENFISSLPAKYFLIEKKNVAALFPRRKKFSHKGTYGHTLVAAGSYGMMGAAVLCTRAALHSGSGLVTSFIPASGYNIIQRSVPESLAAVSSSEKFLSGPLPEKNFSSAVIGPGIGKNQATVRWLKKVLTEIKVPRLLDADALNIISENKTLLKNIPAGTVLTPHPGEFIRLAGKSKNDFERFELQKAFAKKNNVFVVLKGANTCIATPDGKAYFNSTGNPGMAKGGSGDVLSGIIGALLARGLSPLDACIAGVYIHGLAGDIAAEKYSMESMTASDIIDSLAEAFKSIEKK